MRRKAKEFSQQVRDYCKANQLLNRRLLTEQINARFGTDYETEHIKSLCTRMGLKTGRDGCFKPGNIPHPNARPKGPNKTSFKKGNKPANTKPLMHVTEQKGYWKIKAFNTGITKQDYVFCHHLVWHLHHGPVPQGHIIIFIDGDSSNIEIENLRCISRGAHAIINKRGFRNLPQEAIPAGITLGELMHATGVRSRA